MAVKKSETIILDGRVNWPKVQKPELKYKSKTVYEYSVQVECTDAQLKKLKDKGVSPLTKLRLSEEDGRTYINVKKPAMRLDGTPNTVVVTDAEGVPLVSLIGNGSKARVYADILTFDDEDETVAMHLTRIQVTELVEYAPKPREFDPSNGEVI